MDAEQNKHKLFELFEKYGNIQNGGRDRIGLRYSQDDITPTSDDLYKLFDRYAQQPTVKQPTVKQPTVKQPTVKQPTVKQTSEKINDAFVEFDEYELELLKQMKKLVQQPKNHRKKQKGLWNKFVAEFKKQFPKYDLKTRLQKASDPYRKYRDGPQDQTIAEFIANYYK